MNQHSSKGKLKKANVMDVAFKDQIAEARSKNFYMQNSLIGDVPAEEVRRALEASSGVDALLAEQRARQAYNSKIFALDNRYKVLQPLESFIVRLMVKEAVQTNAGLILPSLNKAQGKTHNGYDDDPVTDVYNFAQKAVIVSSPSHEVVLVPGTLVHMTPVQIIVQQREVVGYEFQYVHPDFQGTTVPKSITDQDFGYAIIPRNRIRVIISSPEPNADSVLDAG